MKRCIIVGGADIGNYDYIMSRLSEDFFIFCDSGLRHMDRLGVRPDLIVGDFDSSENPHLAGVETIVLPCEKDATDTLYAVKEALGRGFREFLLIGVIGNRLDHTLGNVYILTFLDSVGAHGVIIDDYSEMELVSREKVFVDDGFSYFSLINITGEARDITIEDAKYPLSGATITTDYQYGISNEPLPGKRAAVSVGEGRALLIKVRNHSLQK